MRAAVREFHSPDAPDLVAFSPPDQTLFAILLEFTVGVEGDERPGGDIFGVVICTPQWLDQKLDDGRPYWPRHHLLVRDYDFQKIRSFIESYVRACSGSDWPELAQKIGRLGHWEFEDYDPRDRASP